MTFIIHMEYWFNVNNCSNNGGSFGNPAAPMQVEKVVHGELMAKVGCFPPAIGSLPQLSSWPSSS